MGNVPVYKVAAIHGTTGDIAVVAAAAGKKTQLHGYVLTGDAGGVGSVLRWEDGSGGTALSGQMTVSGGNCITAPFSPVPWAVTTANTVLNLEVTTAARGHAIYSQVD